MRYRSLACCVLSTLFLTSTQAQTGDWQAVKDIPLGSYIAVTSLPRNAACYFVNATDTELFCDRGGLRIDFHRQNIRRVRLDHPQKSSATWTIIGIAAGAGTGAAVGKTSNDAETRVYSPFIGALFGAIAGFIVGKLVIMPGKVVYRR